MTAYQTDDIYNVVPEHVIEALQADAKLGSGGALAVKTWEQEFRATAAEYNANELPAVAVTCDLAGVTAVSTGELTRAFMVTVWVVTEGGRKTATEQTVKAYAARIERALQQQHDSGKQLSNVPADLLDGIDGAVQVEPLGTAIADAAVQGSNARRGVAVQTFAVSVDFTITID